MDACWLTEEHIHCDACLTRPAIGMLILTRPAIGMLILTSEDGHQVAAWWTCPECADHDAPIHDARGLTVSVLCDLNL